MVSLKVTQWGDMVKFVSEKDFSGCYVRNGLGAGGVEAAGKMCSNSDET